MKRSLLSLARVGVVALLGTGTMEAIKQLTLWTGVIPSQSIALARQLRSGFGTRFRGYSANRMDTLPPMRGLSRK